MFFSNSGWYFVLQNFVTSFFVAVVALASFPNVNYCDFLTGSAFADSVIHPRSDFNSRSDGKKSSPLGKKSKLSGKNGVNQSNPLNQSRAVGIGFVGGWESSYGNSLLLSYDHYGKMIITVGYGYNFSGIKAGVGCDLPFRLVKNLTYLLGTALVRSQGTKDSVTIDGKFTTETGETETVKATRKYQLSPATYVSPRAGLTLNIGGSLDLFLMANYNIILNGNKVTFKGDIKYDKDIRVINTDEAQSQFEDKAEKKVRSGGPGLQLGFHYWI